MPSQKTILDKYLPKHINKTEYIDWLSKCQYPFYLAQIHFRESSFDTGAGNRSYIGLGQHHPDFINKCGYTVKEYNSNWRVQVYVSIEYINKYVIYMLYVIYTCYIYICYIIRHRYEPIRQHQRLSRDCINVGYY